MGKNSSYANTVESLLWAEVEANIRKPERIKAIIQDRQRDLSEGGLLAELTWKGQRHSGAGY